jgi:CBS domain-containing protein
MLCNQIMKIDIQCVFPDDTAASAARKMREQNVGFLPVCDEDGNVLGTLTDRDIAIRCVGEGKPGDTPAGELMTCEVVACKATDDVDTAEEIMGRHQKSRIMCLDEDGYLVGVISLSDVAQHEDGERAARTMRQVTYREAHA